MKRITLLSASLLASLYSETLRFGEILADDPFANTGPFAGSPLVSFDGKQRYQQVYSSDFFDGPVEITSLSFFRSGFSTGIASGTYTFSFSTSVNPVNSLSSDMESNLGPDAKVFRSDFFEGVPPSKFTITGESFYYDPNGGDLLLDIQVDTGGPGFSVISFHSENGTFEGASSSVRSTSISDLSDSGLVTEFVFASGEVPNELEISLGFDAGSVVVNYGATENGMLTLALFDDEFLAFSQLTDVTHGGEGAQITNGLFSFIPSSEGGELTISIADGLPSKMFFQLNKSD